MQNFRNLQVWQKSHELTLLVYEITAEFPKEELFGLRTQLRKTAVDIPAFIAEGCGKPRQEDFAACIGNAVGYANRLEYYALVAVDLGLLAADKYQILNERIVETAKMLSSFYQTLKRG